MDELYFVNKFSNIPLRLVVNNEAYKATDMASLPKGNVFYNPAAIPVSSGSTQLSANPSTSPAVSPIPAPIKNNAILIRGNSPSIPPTKNKRILPKIIKDRLINTINIADTPNETNFPARERQNNRVKVN
ncbi:hypothetical protein B5S43_12800 [Gilliamella apicola]|uniref:hypothetical protein n=2 Tax=Gilliamella apicola TaxID=1196095 RepID=UPI000A33EE9B|nr:hypothetical protein [Gilliamella apicola]OTP89737.1 hypothetical protein B5S43_12800 [Gilliamella apicola]OTQ25650.1 hypothetical protein B6D22_01695 [Gilliamella apicola]